MKLYTRTGDDGTTRLFGNKEVSKSDQRVHAYGDVDELNSAVGLAISACEHEELTAILTTIQHRLFDVGADLSTPVSKSESASHVARIAAQDVQVLEQCIDQTCEPLPAMTQFILPGGGELASRLHIARTVCRRAERQCVELAKTETGVAVAIIYLNRLSDLFFALARRANQLDSIEDVVWQKNNRDNK